MSNLEEYLLIVDNPEYIKEFLDMETCAKQYHIIEVQLNEILQCKTIETAIAKVSVLMREETEAEEFIRKVRDGLFHYKNHPDEPCRCNEKAAAEFMSGLTSRAADCCLQCGSNNWRDAINPDTLEICNVCGNSR